MTVRLVWNGTYKIHRTCDRNEYLRIRSVQTGIVGSARVARFVLLCGRVQRRSTVSATKSMGTAG